MKLKPCPRVLHEKSTDIKGRPYKRRHKCGLKRDHTGPHTCAACYTRW